MLTLPGTEGPRFESLVTAGMRAIQARSDEGGHYQLICNPSEQDGVVGALPVSGQETEPDKANFL